MKTPLPVLRNLLATNTRSFLSALLLLLFLCVSGSSQAQVYYLSSDETATTNSSSDLLYRMNYDGSSNTPLSTAGAFFSPANIVQDLANNRLFILEAVASSRSIKVVNATTGAIQSSIPVPYTVNAMRYDAATNYIYFLTTNSAISTDVSDALYKVKPTDSSPTLIKSSITPSPISMALDIPNNRVFIYESTGGSGRGIKTYDLSSNTFTATALINTGTVKDIAYEPVSGYLYYLTSDDVATSTAATDALTKVLPGGTSSIVIKSGVTASPSQAMVLDAGNNRAYIYEGVTANRAIKAVNLTSGDVTTVLPVSGLPAGVAIKGFAVPLIPVLTTTAASSISSSAATLGGSISKSDISVTARGVVYSAINQTPVIGGTGVSQAANGNGMGSFSTSIGSLSGSTTYYFSAYATSDAGTAYGAVQSFTTPSNDATLSGLTISAGTLNPTFSSGTISYTASVSYANPTITVTPTKNNANASIKVNNVTVTSATASGAIDLNVGSNIITTVVTAQDGTTTKTYTTTVTRDKAAQTITFAGTATKTFGDADFAPGASTNSGLTVSYSSDNTNVATIVGGQIHIVSAGTVNITASQGGDGNTSAASNVVQVLTVNKASQTITFNALPAKTYGNADFAPGATATSGLNVTYSSDNSAVATIVSNQIHIVGQGTATITAIQAGNSTYNAATNATQTLSVGKATVTVTAVAKTKVYGNDDPAFTYTTSGVVGTDAPTGALSRVTPNTNVFVGTYAIDLGTLSYGGNYNITYTGANLTITKRPITILPVAKTKIYGDADPFLNQYQFISGSLAPNDGSTDQYGRAAGESVGSYLMTLGNKKFVSTVTFADVTANYDITIQPAYFTITAKNISVTPNALTKVYGQPDPELTYSHDDLAFNDTFTGSLTRFTGETVNSYYVTVGDLELSNNYIMNFNYGNKLTITPKTVNVTAIAKTKTYGDADPNLDYTADALAFSDGFTGSLTRDAGENVGTHAINQGSLALTNNYVLNYTTANLTIGTKTINVTTNAATKTYGEADPALTYNADALVSGDAFTGSITRTAGETAGSYPITQGSLALSGNYALNYTGANLTIGQRDITINAFAQNVPYGDADPATIGYNVTGGTLATGDAITGALGRAPGSAIGTYAITQNTLAISNSSSYNVTFNSAAFNIIARSITISSPFTTKVYGDADPALSYGVTSGSLLPGDAISGTLVRDAGENSGPYAVRQGTVAVNSSNYDVTYNLRNFEIDRAPLTIKADDKTKLVNAPNPIFTYTIIGFKNGDNESALSNPVAFQNLPLSSAPAGTYSIDLTNVGAQNYDITPQGAVLTIREAAANADLASLSLSNDEVGNVAYTPTFDPATDTYTASVGDNVGYLYLTGVLSDPNASLFRVNGFEATSGNPSVVYVSPGDNQYQIQINAEDGTTTKIYTLNVTRPLDTNADLYAVSYYYGSEYGNIPDLDPNTLDYTVTVPTQTTNVRLYASPSSFYAALEIDGQQPEGLYNKSLAFGDNPVSIKVFAQNRDVTKTYTVNFKRPLPSNNKLFNLTISAGTLSPAFNTDVLNYTATVAGNVSTIDVQPFVADTTAKYKINGNVPADKYQPTTLSLISGQNTITIEVTAKNGDVRNYVVVVTKPSNNAFASFKLNPSSTFKGTTGTATENYITSVAADVTSVMVTPTAQGQNATILINGSPVASGTPSSPILLGAGSTIINVTVNAEDGLVVRTYSLTVNRIGSSNASAAIAVSPTSALTRTTGTGTENYTTSVNPATSSITITPTAQDANATIKVNGTEVASGTPSLPVALNVGTTLVNVEVKAQDGITIRTYTITVNRLGSSNAQVSLKLSPAATLVRTSGVATENFSTSVAAEVNTVTLAPTAQDAGAVILVNGAAVASGTQSGLITLTGTSTLINVAVTAADGITTRSYSVTVNKTGSSNAVATVVLSPSSTLARVTGAATENYTTSVSFEQTSVTLTTTTQDAGATIKVNESVVESGTGLPVALTGTSTNINVAVTAQDGVTIRTYSIVVGRNGSSNAQVALNLTPAATFTRVTGSATENFVTSVNPATSSVTLTPTALAAGAVIKVNGATVTSGAPSAQIALTGISTVIAVEVTAQDGVTIRTYSVTVNKTGSSNAYATLKLTPSSVFVRTTGSADENFTSQAAAGVNSVTLTPTTQDAAAVVTVNGEVIASGSPSAPIALTNPATMISVVVTAQNGVTVRAYKVQVNRTGPNPLLVSRDDANKFYTKNANSSLNTAQDVVVHQGVSPNGDGFNDFLAIEGLSSLTGNKISIMNTSGTLVFEMKDYGKDGSRVFDGRGKNGNLLNAGTYYYTLDYKDGGKDKRKTGYIILKY